MTGLTDAIRADFRVMKDIAQHTRVGPQHRKNAMLKFIDNIYRYGVLVLLTLHSATFGRDKGCTDPPPELKGIR